MSFLPAIEWIYSQIQESYVLIFSEICTSNKRPRRTRRGFPLLLPFISYALASWMTLAVWVIYTFLLDEGKHYEQDKIVIDK